MYIGSIINKESGINGSYFFAERGTQIPLSPDLSTGEVCSEVSLVLGEGNLFCGKATGWKWETVLDIGVDIIINLEKECFIDRIILQQNRESGMKSVVVLCARNGEDLHITGRVDAATNGMLGEEKITVVVGAAAVRLVVRLTACFENIIINGMDIIGAILDRPFVYPVPNSINMDYSNSLMNKDLESILIGREASGDTIFAAKMFSEKIREKYALDIPVRKMDQTQSFYKAIVFGQQGEIAGLDEYLDGKTNAEGYQIKACQDRIYLKGADRRGLIYGTETLLLLMQDGYIDTGTVNDSPCLPIRGIHTSLPAREEIPFFKRLIRYCLAPMHLNTLYIQFTAGMRFDKHPEINDAWLNAIQKAKAGEWPQVPHGHVAGGGCLEKEEVRELLDYARSYGFEVIPEVQSLSHVGYLTMTYPEIAEMAPFKAGKEPLDLIKEDMYPDEFYPNCYCPSNEKSYQIIFDILDEIIEVAKPERYVNMGHDEAYSFGVCPLCQKKDPAELFAMDVNRLHAYLASKNLKMMIWADMLHTVTAYKTSSAIDKIPRDIILLDFIWYFHLDKDIENRLLKHGFKVIMGNMYSSHFPRFEARSKKAGMVGAEVSTWVQGDEYHFGFEGKIYDLMYSANMMWSAQYRSDARLAYNQMITAMIPGIRSQIHDERYPSQSKTKSCSPVILPIITAAGSFPCELLATLPPAGLHTISGIPFHFGSSHILISLAAGYHQAASSLIISVNACYDSLIFLQATLENAKRIPWEHLMKIGEYAIKYEDGEIVTVPIEYGGNIGVWFRRYGDPMLHSSYRHQGYVATYLADPYIQSKTPDGQDVTLYGYEWINPRKNHLIVSISLNATGNTDAAVMLFAMTGVRESADYQV
jgi:hypothetical protein